MHWIKVGCGLLLAGCVARPPSPPPPLPDTAVVQLTHALPPTGPQVQEITEHLLAVGAYLEARDWEAVRRHLKLAQESLRQSEAALLIVTPVAAQPAARQSLLQLNITLAVLDSTPADRSLTLYRSAWQQSLWNLATLRLAILRDYRPPGPPRLYQKLPRFAGWALMRVRTNLGAFTVLADGYSAPLGVGALWMGIKQGRWRGTRLRMEEGISWERPTSTLPLEIRPLEGRLVFYNPTSAPAPALNFSPPGVLALRFPSDLKNQPDTQQLAPAHLVVYGTRLTPAQAQVRNGRQAVIGYVIAGLEVVNRLNSSARILEITPVTCTRNSFEADTVNCLLVNKS